MTSRERILATINHTPPDRVPVDMSATPSSGISAIAYSNLVAHLGRSDLPVLIYDVVQQLAQPDQSILDQFGVDVLDIGRSFNDSPEDWYQITMANGASGQYPVWYHPVEQSDGSFLTYDDDGKRVLSKMPVGATFFDQTYFPYVDGYPDDYASLGAEMNRIMWARHAHSPWDHTGEKNLTAEQRDKIILILHKL